MPRPPIPLLSRDRIRHAALALIDEHGLEGLSMRLLARRLGVQAASLYSHFRTKDEVLDAVANLLTRQVDTAGFDQGWTVGLTVWGRSYRAALQAHPNAARSWPQWPANGLTSWAWPTACTKVSSATAGRRATRR